VARLTVTGTASLERISAEVSIGKKNPARGRALSLGDGHEHQHVWRSTLTPMKPFQNCRAGGSASYS
jgi:hypothetical protein